MFIVGLNQQIPTFSIHLFIRSVLYLFINQAGQVQLQPGLIVGGWNLGGGGGGGCVIKSGMFGKRCEIKGLVSGAPCGIQELSSKLDN